MSRAAGGEKRKEGKIIESKGGGGEKDGRSFSSFSFSPAVFCPGPKRGRREKENPERRVSLLPSPPPCRSLPTRGTRCPPPPPPSPSQFFLFGGNFWAGRRRRGGRKENPYVTVLFSTCGMEGGGELGKRGGKAIEWTDACGVGSIGWGRGGKIERVLSSTMQDGRRKLKILRLCAAQVWFLVLDRQIQRWFLSAFAILISQQGQENSFYPSCRGRVVPLLYGFPHATKAQPPPFAILQKLQTRFFILFFNSKMATFQTFVSQKVRICSLPHIPYKKYE